MRTSIVTLLLLSLLTAVAVRATIVVDIKGISGDSQFPGYRQQINAESYSFSINRTEPAAGGKPTSSENNIGSGTPDVLRLHASFDSAATALAQSAISGTSLPSATITLLAPDNDSTVPGALIPFLLLHVEPAFIKAWVAFATDDRPSVTFEIWYNRITLQTASTEDGKNYAVNPIIMGWDRVLQSPWNPPFRLNPDGPGTINHAPVGHPGQFTTTEGAAVIGQLVGSDDDGDPLTYSRERNPVKGSVTVESDGRFTYTPNPGATGLDSFSFSVNDGHDSSSATEVTIQINGVTPVISRVNPDSAAANSGSFSLAIEGSGFLDGAELLWDGQPRTAARPDANTFQVDVASSELATSENILTYLIEVRNPSGLLSNPEALTIVGDVVEGSESDVAEIAHNVAVSLPPTPDTPAGIDAVANNAGQPDPLTITVAQYSENPTSTAFQLDATYLDVQVTGADDADSATVNFHYPATVTGANETLLQLHFFDGSLWSPVFSSGGILPAKNTTDISIDGVPVGGTITVIFDDSSTPRITELTGTEFGLGPDSEPPVIQCPADISVGNDPGACGAVVDYPVPSVTDDFGPFTLFQSGGLGPGATFPVGSTVESYTATDMAGNSASCSFTITVTDTESPVAVCRDFAVQLSSNGTATLTPSDLDAGSADNCGIDSLTLSQSQFDSSHLGAETVTLTVTDIHGNSASCSATVTVEDDPAATAGPQLADDEVRRFPGFDLKIRVEDLLENDPDKADVTLTEVGPAASSQAATFLSDPWVFYQPNGVTTDDSFTYTARNAAGIAETATVTVRVVDDPRMSLNIVSITTRSDGTVILKFQGIPGQTYRVQFTTKPTHQIDSEDDWQTLDTLMADTTGRFMFEHLPALNSNVGLYRSISP